MKHFRLVFSFFSGVALFTAATASADAIEIKYDTFGIFDCHGIAGCTVTSNATGNATVTVADGSGNSSKLVFIPWSDDIVAAADNSDFPAVFEAGVITPSGKKDGVPFVSMLNHVTLDIRIFQSIPGPSQSGSFVGELDGNVSVIPGTRTTNSTASITFGRDPLKNPEIVLNGVIYQLDANVYSIDVGGSPIHGTIDGSTAPEPAFFALTGVGFFGMLGLAWSHSKRRA